MNVTGANSASSSAGAHGGNAARISAVKFPLGTGIYSVPTAARLAEVLPRRVHRWVRGRELPSEGGRKRSQPFLSRDLPEINGRIALSFLDLIEVRMVKAFLDKGVGMRAIRAAAVSAAEILQSPHPFCLERFKTDGRTVFAQLVADPHANIERESRAPMLDLVKRQVAIREVMEPLLLQVDYEDDLSARWWPRGRRSGVVLDPRKSFGSPIVASCAIPTEILADAYVAEGSVAAAAKWYDVHPRAVRDAVAFERWLSAA